jgi:starch synthase
MIQRLAEQKGIDIVVEAAEELLKLPLQLVILGTGDPIYHEQLTHLAAQCPDRLAVNLRFDNALAHQIEAGADAFLMPSRFEPCGLNQMYSMRYGTVPIVRRVGGLADTVVDVSPASLEANEATGFVFADYTAQALLQTVKRAVAAFRDHALWGKLIRSGMQRDFSWDHAAKEYVTLYERVLAR